MIDSTCKINISIDLHLCAKGFLFELFSKPWDQEAFFEARAYFFNYTSF
jgi:hypothetical protein